MATLPSCPKPAVELPPGWGWVSDVAAVSGDGICMYPGRPVGWVPVGRWSFHRPQLSCHGAVWMHAILLSLLIQNQPSRHCLDSLRPASEWAVELPLTLDVRVGIVIDGGLEGTIQIYFNSQNHFCIKYT